MLFLLQLSDVLGYKNHASYITEVRCRFFPKVENINFVFWKLRMAKTADAVQKFLAELGERIKPLRDRELDVFLKYKSSEVKKYADITQLTY